MTSLLNSKSSIGIGAAAGLGVDAIDCGSVIGSEFVAARFLPLVAAKTATARKVAHIVFMNFRFLTTCAEKTSIGPKSAVR